MLKLTDKLTQKLRDALSTSQDDPVSGPEGFGLEVDLRWAARVPRRPT